MKHFTCNLRIISGVSAFFILLLLSPIYSDDEQPPPKAESPKKTDKEMVLLEMKWTKGQAYRYKISWTTDEQRTRDDIGQTITNSSKTEVIAIFTVTDIDDKGIANITIKCDSIRAEVVLPDGNKTVFDSSQEEDIKKVEILPELLPARLIAKEPFTAQIRKTGHIIGLVPLHKMMLPPKKEGSPSPDNAKFSDIKQRMEHEAIKRIILHSYAMVLPKEPIAVDQVWEAEEDLTLQALLSMRAKIKNTWARYEACGDRKCALINSEVTLPSLEPLRSASKKPLSGSQVTHFDAESGLIAKKEITLSQEGTSGMMQGNNKFNITLKWFFNQTVEFIESHPVKSAD